MAGQTVREWISGLSDFWIFEGGGWFESRSTALKSSWRTGGLLGFWIVEGGGFWFETSLSCLTVFGGNPGSSFQGVRFRAQELYFLALSGFTRLDWA